MKFVFVNIGMLMFRGGGENFAINLSRSLRGLGHSTELYCLKPFFGRTVLQPANEFSKVVVLRSPWLSPITAFFHRYSFLRRIKGLRGVPRIVGQAIFEFKVFLELRKRKEDDFVVVSCGLPLLPFLVNRYLSKLGILRMPGPIENIYDEYFGKRSSAIIANGHAHEQIEKCIKAENLHFIDIGVFDFRDILTDEVADFRRSCGIARGQLCILFVGRCIPIKNIPMLIRAWHKLTDSGVDGKLLIAGDGPELVHLRQLAISLNMENKISFLGNRNKDQLALLYHAADCCVLPSRYDNFPNVLIESLSCGTPCVGTQVGGIPQIIQHEKNGFLVLPDDVDGLANAIAKIAANPDLFDRQQIKLATRENYSWDKSAQSFIFLVENQLRH